MAVRSSQLKHQRKYLILMKKIRKEDQTSHNVLQNQRTMHQATSGLRCPINANEARSNKKPSNSCAVYTWKRLILSSLKSGWRASTSSWMICWNTVNALDHSETQRTNLLCGRSLADSCRLRYLLIGNCHAETGDTKLTSPMATSLVAKTADDKALAKIGKTCQVWKTSTSESSKRL